MAIDTDAHVVVVGASLAGVRGAEAIRRTGHRGPITILGDEGARPYDRPPLSKAFLAGDVDEERLWLERTPSALSDQGIVTRVGVRAVGLSIDNSLVATTEGPVPFDALMIATGTSVRRLPYHRDAPVFVMRTMEDSLRLRSRLKPQARIVIIGAGFIGAEIASTAKAKGCQVTIVEALPVPLERQLGAEMGAAIASIHERNGVTLRSGVGVTSIGADHVELADGTTLDADVIVVGIGVYPNTDWLEGQGVALDNGVLCDEACRVLDHNNSPLDHIVACGDVARWPNGRYNNETMRIEHWTNAVEMSAHAADTLINGPSPFTPVPYFWSDQYGAKIQFFGRATDFDEVRMIDGDFRRGPGLALYRKGDRLVAVLGVQKMRASIALRALLVENASFDEALAKATS